MDNLGGILIIWNPEAFSKISSWNSNEILVVNDYWKEVGKHVCIINVYALGILKEKMIVWDVLEVVLGQQNDECLFVVGDFNSIRAVEERRGRSQTLNYRDIHAFDNLILRFNLIELPLIGRTYTCYHADGTCKSRLDHMFVNNEWIVKWPNLSLKGRTFSNHCPIYLSQSCQDWGPKPFRFFYFWLSHPNFKEFISKK